MKLNSKTLHTRLNVIDGKVLCARTCQWKEVEGCAACRDLRRFEHGPRGDIVDCDPEITRSVDQVMYDLMRA